MLLFRVGDEPWALAAADVKDIVPFVTLQPFTAAMQRGSAEQLSDSQIASPDSAGLVGLLNYHGDRIPVVDVSALMGHPCATQVMSTRIAIVELLADDVGNECVAKLGLILDRAYEMADLSERVVIPIQQAYVQEMFKGPQAQVIRRLSISPLLYPTALHAAAAAH